MGYYHFPKPVILEVSGKDAERYLQARLTNDVKKLTDTQSCLAACLTPQGKTLAVLYVYKIHSEQFILASLGGQEDLLIKDLGCFIVADRVEIKALQYNLLASQEGLAQGFDYQYQPAFSGDNFYYLLTDDQMGAFSTDQKIKENEYILQRIKSGRPYYPFDLPAECLFPETGLLEAVSSTKGCYAGQEVVERSIALGKLPAEIRAYQADIKKLDIQDPQLLADFQIVDEENQVAGKPVSWVVDKGMIYFFARVRSKFLEKSLLLEINTSKVKLKSVLSL